MRILFDQGATAPLRDCLPGHQVSTAYEMGWSTLENGQLLGRAQASGFEVVVTTDKNMNHQQHLIGRSIAVVALSTTSWPRIRERVELVNRALTTARPGTWQMVEI